MARGNPRIQKTCTKCGDQYRGNIACPRSICAKCRHCLAIGNWNKRNREKVDAWATIRKKKHPYVKLGIVLRGRLRCALIKMGYSGIITSGIPHLRHLGTDIKTATKWIENQFQPGMSWANHGFGANKWNIDHIQPLSSFNLFSEKDLAIVCNYKNLRPIWQSEHMSMPRPKRRVGL